jgi:parallel beta-helix repeat protein
MNRLRPLAAACYAAALAALMILPGIANALTVQITTGISANTSWGLPGSGSTVEADVFWIRNAIGIDFGVTLTVRQGVTVKFDPYTYLSVNGSLQAQGTAVNNVVFTSIRDDNPGGDTNGDGGATLPNPSDWQSLYIAYHTTPDSTRLTYTQVKFAGYGGHGAVTFTNCSGRLTNCTIQRSYFGVDCSGTSTPLLIDTNVQASTYTPIVLDFVATPVFSNLVFSSSDNGYDAFGLRGGTLASTVSLPKRGATVGLNPVLNVTYVLISGLTINPGASLTINPGVVVKPLGGVGFGVYGNLTMNGTVADTITVTSISDDNFGRPLDTNNNGSITAPSRGDWANIIFYSGSTGSMNYCRIKFGANSDYNGLVEVTDVNLPVSNTILSDAGHGIMIHNVAAPVLNNVQINNCSSTPILQSVSATPTFTNVTFLANALTALGLIGETIGVDSHLTQKTIAGFANITYLVMNGYITMSSPAKLTIDPGVVLKFYGYYTGLVINGALDAQGTGPSPIIFTSYRDDLYGNPADTNGDGSITTPDTYNWGYILFNDTANDAQCRISRDRILYGSYQGYDYNSQIWCVNASPTISDNIISKVGYGVRCKGNSAPIITNNTIQNCQLAPILMSVQADPTMTGNVFLTNGVNGLALEYETLSQDAVLKYRPTVTFPAPNQTTVFAYVPTGTITVPSGVTLSIQPKVVLKPMSSFTLFDVYGAMNVVGGTGANRIIITSFHDDAWNGDTNANGSASTPGVGQWGNIVFEDTSVDPQCLLRNMLFQFGINSVDGVVTTVSASPKLAALEFFQNGTALTCKGNSKPNCDSLTILNCTYLPISMSLISDPVFAHMTFANNSWTALGLLGETIGQDVRTYPRVLGAGILNGMSYFLTGNITIAFGAKWTITPGTVIKMGRVYYESFGNYIQIDGTLVANGKPDSLIVFTSSADDAFGGDSHGDGAASAPGLDNWVSIAFTGVSNSAATVVNNCRFRYGGFSGWAALRCLSSNTNVTNCTFYQCSTGPSAEGNAAPTFTNVNIDTCNVPVRMSLVSNPTFTNVNFVGCTYTALGVISETIAQDMLWKIRAVSGRVNMPYLVDGTLGVGLGSTMSLQPGLIVKFYGGAIDVNRAFLAEGRTLPESLIVFTSYRDDFYGGRTWANPYNTAPGYGDWGSITIEGTAIDAQTRFRDCVLRYGGYSGAIRCINSAPSVDSCLISYNYIGVGAEGASNPTIHGSSLYGNFAYGVSNTGGSFCLDASHNYWGAASGPNDASAAGDICGTASNAGSGDLVTQNVDYSSFTTAGLLNPLLGDVSLNGQVHAFDAGMVLQFLVPSIALSPLQKLVANVDNSVAIDNTDASLILQYVAGLLPTLPANQTRAREASPQDLVIARAASERMNGTFRLEAGPARRNGDHWEVPILASGTAPIFGAEIRLAGPAAGELSGVHVPEGAMEAHGTPEGTASLAMASATPMAEGEIASFVFPAHGDSAWSAPAVSWARVNREVVTFGTPPPVVPASAFFASPWPNPAGGAVSLRLGITAKAAGGATSVRVFDTAGRLVRNLHEGPHEAGVLALTWDLLDGTGRKVAPGIYLVRAQTNDMRQVHRLVVVR